MKNLPKARTAEIVVQALGKEVLIYNLATHKAYNLNETLSTVYQACDGQTTIDELKIKASLNDDIIFLALSELKMESLLEQGTVYDSPFDGISRREVIKRVGLASLITLPIISSLVVPTAAMAQSGGQGGACINPGVACTQPLTKGNCCGSSYSCSSAGACRFCSNAGAVFFCPFNGDATIDRCQDYCSTLGLPDNPCCSESAVAYGTGPLAYGCRCN